jgi:hypothetical protein
MDVLFFATPSTLHKLRGSESTKVLLAGGFNGWWNFGDILQLQGAIHWHRSRLQEAVIAPLNELAPVKDTRYLHQLRSTFGVDDFIFYSPEPTAAALQQARSLGLEPIFPPSLQGPSLLHVYGGGIFNRFWGGFMLRLVESVLRTWLPSHYVVSGQQVNPDFADEYAAHALRWQPALVGCRDPLSVKALVERGLDAKLSGDDALEEMSRAAEGARHGQAKGSFGLHMNLSSYVYTGAPGEEAPSRAPISRLNEQLELLRSRFGGSANPLVINAYIDDRSVVEDTVASLRKTAFSQLFPRAGLVDLAGALMQENLAQAAEQILGCELLLVTSYHTSLFGKVVGVPTYLCAFNAYYEQKKAGLGEPTGSFQEFLEGDLAQVVEAQDRYVARQREIRREWLGELASCLDCPTASTSWVARVNGWLADTRSELEQRRKHQQELESRVATQEETLRATREQCTSQQARLAELERERAELEQGRAKLEHERAKLEHERAKLEHECTELERERSSLQSQLHAREARLATQAEELAALRSRHEALLATVPPLRHRLVDELNNRLKGSSLLHERLKHVVGTTFDRLPR